MDETSGPTELELFPNKPLIDPVACLASTSHAGLNKYAVRSIRRRSQVYATTRHLIASRGLPNVTIRSIAEQSEISVQSLYNLIGGRATIIAESINEYLAHLAEMALSDEGYDNRIVAMADIHSLVSVKYSCFTLNSLSGPTAMRVFDGTVEKFISDVQYGFLNYLRMSLVLKTTTDVRLLARSIILFSINLVADWNGNPALSQDFRKQLVTGVSGLLLASLEPEAQAKLGTWLDNFLISLPSSNPG
ncbi:TetR/AcrR family transcriptional regulator [Rhizorhabdus argentea]|uniref:TetR/AcrR family transcriptional regulator n=1 Tax=Rhizorhabdus argentea TaxID=1387174 RepID=UPI0030EDA8DC